MKSYRAEGLSFLTRGMTSTLLRAFIMNSVCFFVVSWTLKNFDNSTIEVAIGSNLEPITIIGNNNVHSIINHDDHIVQARTQLKNSLKYMGTSFSDAVYNNEIIELANDLYDDREHSYYKLNIDKLSNLKSISENNSNLLLLSD